MTSFQCAAAVFGFNARRFECGTVHLFLFDTCEDTHWVFQSDSEKVETQKIVQKITRNKSEEQRVSAETVYHRSCISRMRGTEITQDGRKVIRCSSTMFGRVPATNPPGIERRNCEFSACTINTHVPKEATPGMKLERTSTEAHRRACVRNEMQVLRQIKPEVKRHGCNSRLVECVALTTSCRSCQLSQGVEDDGDARPDQLRSAPNVRNSQLIWVDTNPTTHNSQSYGVLGPAARAVLLGILRPASSSPRSSCSQDPNLPPQEVFLDEFHGPQASPDIYARYTLRKQGNPIPKCRLGHLSAVLYGTRKLFIISTAHLCLWLLDRRRSHRDGLYDED
ncbi:hypothetical protein BD410DRAFT_807402 [Rickenella mellea]|uniref:Uncharacterized protein n=1 Tax=Rickenella mellea TaxID=50990 RepID=A0A4Y7PQG4_9AGAM|nr:hypothetical protein BD410DRAFT_807402 [Rickenella mellea]